MSRTLVAVLVSISVALVAAPAVAQKRDDVAKLSEKIAAVEARLAELQQATVQVPTALEAIQELSQQVAALTQALDKVQAEHRSVPDAVARLDDLTSRLGAAERELALLRTTVAGLGQASTGGSGGAVSYRDGFHWATGDGAYSLALTGVLAARYQAVMQGKLTSLDQSTFSVPRARLGAAGTLGSPKLAYQLRMDVAGTPAALDVYGDYAFRPELALRFGQYKTPFTRIAQTEGEDLAFPERPEMMTRLAYDRDLGVGLHGLLLSDRLDYFVGLQNGGGANRPNDNIDFLVVARVEGRVLGEQFARGYGDTGRTEQPTLSVGAGVTHDLVAVPDRVIRPGGTDIVLSTDVDGDGDRDNVRVLGASADAVFRLRGLEVAVEGILRYEQWGTILDGNPDLQAALAYQRKNRSYISFYGQATYLLPHQILVGARLAHGRLPLLGIGGRESSLPHPACFGRCDGVRLLEADGLVQLYNHRGQRMVGLQYSLLDYNAKDGGDLDADKEQRITAEAQVRF